MKNEKTNIILTTIASVIIFAGFIFFAIGIKKVFMRQAYYAITESTNENAYEIETAYDYASSSIKLVSQFTTSKMDSINLESPNEIISLYSEKTPFNFIEYIRYDGLNLMDGKNEDQAFDASDRPYYQNGIKGITGTWNNYSPKLASEVLIDFYTPLYYEGKIAGVLTGVMGGETQIKPILDSSFFGQQITGILCDENLKVISSTTENMIPGLNLKDHSDVQIISDIIDHANSKDINPFKYILNKKEGICCVQPVKNANWYIVMFVYPKTLANAMKELSIHIYGCLIFIILIIISYFLIRLYRNKKSSQEIEKTHINIINALGLVYQNVYAVDIETSKLYIYRMSDRIKSKYEQTLHSTGYKEGMKIYLTNEVFEKDWHFFDPILDLEKIKKLFSNRSEYSFTYRVIRDGGIHYFKCHLFMPSKDSKEFVAGFKNVDQTVTKNFEEESKINRLIDMQTTQNSILSSIAGIYLTTHLIDLKKDIIVEFNTSKEVRTIMENNNIDHAVMQMKKVIKTVVTQEYVDAMLEFTDLTTISERLYSKKIISKEFIGIHNGWTRASFIAVETDEYNIPFKVLFLTQVIDDEKRREQSLINTANNDELTGLSNRHAYEEYLQTLTSQKLPDDLVYISFDVNGLKNINDSLGHEAGDELIQGAADCLSQAFGQYGKVFRTGGDEFQGIIFASTSELENIKNQFDEITNSWKGKRVDEVRISAGYVSFSEYPDSDIKEIIKIADQRMYRSKTLFYSNKGINRRGQQAAYEVLCDSYTKILKIDLTSDSFSIIRMNEDEKDAVKGYNEKLSLWLTDFGKSGFVHKNDIDFYISKINLDYMREYFKSGKKNLGFQYRRKIGEVFRHVIMEIIPAKEYTNENQILFLYVKDIEKPLEDNE